MNSSIGMPEGFIILILLFGFPFLIARKNVFNLEEIIHAYMSDSHRIIYPYIQKMYVIFANIRTFINPAENR